VRELYQTMSDRRLSAKLVPTFADRGCHVVSVTDPYKRIIGFLDRSHYFFFQVAPQLYSRGWVDPVQDPLLLRKSGSVWNWTRTSGSVARNCDLFTKLYSRGWVDPVPDPLLLRKSGSVWNRTRTSGSVARNCDLYTTEAVWRNKIN
jgi:hypothetical protein